MSWQYVDIEEAYIIHGILIRRAKTKATIRDFTLLHSAVERPKATFNGEELYPDVFSKAAALLQSLCLNHPFSDGNKRTAWTVTHRFLWINKYRLLASRKDGVGFMLYVDNSHPPIEKISLWLKKHSKKI